MNSFIRIKKTTENLVKEKILSPYNLLRILGMIAQGKAFVGPLKTVIDITNECDMHCIMCWYHSSHVENPSIIRQLPLENFKDLALQLKSIKTKIISICGEGEPLLHPNIKEMICFARENGLEIEIMTNGYYLDKEMARFIKDIKVKKILLSLHSADEETSRKIRPQKTANDFKKIIDNLYYLRKLKSNSPRPQIFITNVISSLNCGNIFKMAKLAKELKIDKILFKPLIFSPQLPSFLNMSFEQKYILSQNLKTILKNIDTPNNINAYLKILTRKPLKRSVDKINILSRDKNKRGVNLCHIPYVQSVIGIKGDVIGCVYAKKKSLGNIYEQSFKDIWFSKTYKNFRKGLYCPKKCLGKSVYPLSI